MSIYVDVKELGSVQAPWGREVRLQEVEIDGGLTILRVRIREGRRFTDLELTREKAVEIGEAITAWGRNAPGE